MNISVLETGVILIVDDNPNNLEVLSETLMDTGWEILIAVNGEGAIAQAEYACPDIILLDVMMPGIDGFTACQRLKLNPVTCDIPIIFMTALSETVDKVKGLSLGAVDYITKPFEHEEVLARIKTHLQIRNLTKQLKTHNQKLKQEIADRLAVETKLQKLTQELEQSVEQRTSQLSQALQNFQQAQVTLVQQEKMSTLGELVAGIAHEINNPVNFIYGNLSHAKGYIEDIVGLLNLYQADYPNPTPRIQAEQTALDMDFIQDDLLKLFSSVTMGAQRIRDIVKSMRTFSRVDEASVKTVDIHEGIESTLTILDHRLKVGSHNPAIAVVREYGQLPLVECCAGQLNQVFMNILSNAIDALEEYSQQQMDQGNARQPRQIRISTEIIRDNWIAIRIADDGSGIDEKLKARLFDPFFTTKPAGKGTGLGLSISYALIVEMHGGNLYCQSALGEDTEFVVEIPIRQDMCLAA